MRKITLVCRIMKRWKAHCSNTTCNEEIHRFSWVYSIILLFGGKCCKKCCVSVSEVYSSYSINLLQSMKLWENISEKLLRSLWKESTMVQVKRNAISIHMSHTSMSTIERLQEIRSWRTGKRYKNEYWQSIFTSEAFILCRTGVRELICESRS